jgi:hypothetical protein
VADCFAHFCLARKCINYGAHELNACNKYAWIPYSVSNQDKGRS